MGGCAHAGNVLIDQQLTWSSFCCLSRTKIRLETYHGLHVHFTGDMCVQTYILSFSNQDSSNIKCQVPTELQSSARHWFFVLFVSRHLLTQQPLACGFSCQAHSKINHRGGPASFLAFFLTVPEVS